MNQGLKKLFVTTGIGALCGLLSVLGTIWLFWAQGSIINIGGLVLDWSWMGIPLGYGVLVGGLVGLLTFVALHFLGNRYEMLRFRDENLLRAASRDVYQFERENEDLNDRLRTFSEALQLEQQSNEQLREELNQAESHNPEIEELQNEVDGLRTELQGVHMRADQLEQDLGVARADKQTLEQEVADLKNALAATGAPASS